jgi:hypothetical protein
MFIGYKKWDAHLGPPGCQKMETNPVMQIYLKPETFALFRQTPLLEKAVFTRFYCQYSGNLQASRQNVKFKKSSQNR